MPENSTTDTVSSARAAGYTARVFMVRWAMAWIELADALVRVLTAGICKPDWGFWAQGWFLDEYHRAIRRDV